MDNATRLKLLNNIHSLLSAVLLSDKQYELPLKYENAVCLAMGSVRAAAEIVEQIQDRLDTLPRSTVAQITEQV